MLTTTLLVLFSLTEEYSFVGWTQDSAFFVVKAVYSKDSAPEYRAHPAWGHHPEPITNADWEKWVAAHPLAPPCADACRSPDGRRVAHRNEVKKCDEFNGCAQWVEPRFEPVGSPRIQLMWGDLDRSAPARIAAAIGKAGFVTTAWDIAKADRATSVVYAAKGQEAFAKKLAAAVPGGATVEPLTWKTRFELVVALGKTAQQ